MIWVDEKTGLKIEASAVATQEATDEDSNALRGKTADKKTLSLSVSPLARATATAFVLCAYLPFTAPARRRAISSRISCLWSSPTPRKGRGGMTLPGWRTALRTSLSPLRP